MELLQKVLRPSKRQISLSGYQGDPALWEIPGSSSGLYYIPLGIDVPRNVSVSELNLRVAPSRPTLYPWLVLSKDLLVDLKGVRDVDTMVFLGAPFHGVTERTRVSLVETATLIKLVEPISGAS